MPENALDSRNSDPTQPVLKVAVLIDHRPNHKGEVGGLARTWEQLSSAARGFPQLDLTVFFLGDSYSVVEYGQNVRHELLPPVLGTDKIPFLSATPTHTDLAPFHLPLFRRLAGFDVLHTTDMFYSFANTALWKSRISKLPLVNSVQTDIISMTRTYTPIMLRRILSTESLVEWLIRDLKLLERQARSMEKRMGRYMRRCAGVFVSHQRDLDRARRLAPETPVFPLRRGIDLEGFHPKWRNRNLLLKRFGIPVDKRVLLIVGRVDPAKGAMIAANVVKGLLDRKKNVHLLVVGDGVQRNEVADLLGNAVTLTGNLPHRELGWIYAGSDMLIFPSETEVWPNVVAEAMASGLPVVTCERGAGHVYLDNYQNGILLPNRDIGEWITAIESLLKDDFTLGKMGKKARETIEKQGASWQTILKEDLLPVWQRAARGKGLQ
jgi:glycosyltransferase involved in cell wall biosynthesis